MTLSRLTRWQAAPIHLAISATIAVVVIGAMYFLWYPQPYFAAAGGKLLVAVIVGVDVVVGPLLTLIVFDPRKKHLKWDLAVIAALQIAALAYGVSVMFEARPVYVAFVRDRFQLVAANDIADAERAKATNPAFRELPLAGPVIVGTRAPQDPKEAERIATASLLGASLGLFPQHFIPYATVARDAASRAKPLASLRAARPERGAEIDAFVARAGKPEAALKTLPLVTVREDMTVVLDGETGEVLGVLPFTLPRTAPAVGG
jgi:hypothetical protein